MILRKGGEGLQSKEKSSKGAADGLGFCSYGIVRGRWGDNFDHGRYHDISLGKDSG